MPSPFARVEWKNCTCGQGDTKWQTRNLTFKNGDDINDEMKNENCPKPALSFIS